MERFIKEHPEDKILVFVRTKVRAERVAKAMHRAEIPALFIHGDKDQRERLEAMQSFRTGRCRTLIATDVSARGIDIPDVQVVINYDIPDVTENYVHRVGRTGRGVHKGLAISFCSEEEKTMLADIEQLIGKPVPELSMDRGTYAETLMFSHEKSLEELISSQEAFEATKKKKGKKK
nr:C-terminal helicase domain-containing protein [Desulfobotulus pelophilus]